ncbi:S24 family peptidase [Nocardioides sp. R1-1]|uniref:S24 family peptidase n=1 Tax=Nocardioides sp. R1-1 TaxID=3383502 RepID=UPI0038D24FD7
MGRGTTGGRRRVGMAVVRGASMTPALRPGQRLLVVYGAPVRAGKVVVARFADGTLAVKRAAERRAGGWWLLSDNAAAGVDSRHRGVVPDDDVAGVVRARLWPWPRLL